MFSSRLPETLEPNDFTRLLQAKKAAGEQIFDLTQSNPTKAMFSFEYFQKNTSFGNCEPYEPSARGMLQAREAICQYYRDNDHGSCDADDLFLTASTSEAYSFLLNLLTDPGDELLVPAPSYPLFDFLASLENVTTAHYGLGLDGDGQWRIDFESLELMVSSLTKAIVVVNPNNPTGSYITSEELRRLNALCQRHKLALIVDEVFLDYKNPARPGKPLSLINNSASLTFTLSGFSKILALPQAKLSWIHVGGPEALKIEAKDRLEFIADTYLSVGGMIQHGAPLMFAGQAAIQQQIMARIEANERFLLTQTTLRTHLREGGWYAIIQLPAPITDEACCLDLLERHSLIVHPGFFYDFAESSCIVISLITQETVFRQGLVLLQSYLESCFRQQSQVPQGWL
nr:pyridoxal phosphate-dependent aminotransferase [Desulfobulbaceae bacterium]